MNQQGNYDWHIPQRQSTAGLLVMLYKTVITIFKSMWVLIIVVIFRSGDGQREPGFLEYSIIAISLYILIHSLVEFVYFRFYMVNDELIIKKGFLRKKNIAIPLQKIQAVHIEQSILHQLLEIVKVKIDTAGSEKTEAVIDAIPAQKAEQLKAFLLHERQQLVGDSSQFVPTRDVPIIRLGASDILKLGISANHIQAFFIVLAALISYFQNLREAFGEGVVRTVEESAVVKQLLSSIPLLVLLVMFISVVVSMVTILLKYYDFTLAEAPSAFKLKSGLINSRQFVVPFNRIQFISWEANWIRRKIGLFFVELHQVSGNKVNEKQRVKVPVTRYSFIEKLFEQYHALVQPVAHSEHRIHKVYPLRRMLIAGLLPMIILLPASQLNGWNAWWLLLLLWAPYKFLNAWFYRKNFRLFIAPDAFQVNSGIWGREVRVVKWYKIQQVKLNQSIYQRSRNLATLKIYTAGGYVKIPFIPLELAKLLQDYALYEAERTHRPWL
jgi:putative membrane protein